MTPFAASRSFRLAARLLPRAVRDDTAAAYAWCRRVDDAIDERPQPERAAALHDLRRELDALYGDAPPADPIAAAFQQVIRRRGIPRAYPEALIEGMAMDVAGARYATLDDLLLYCHRVAGVVGLIMGHVMGVSRPAALRRAAHLGIAMQLTNICRDVAEDLDNGRMYLPERRLAREPVPQVVARLLDEADRYYRSGETGVTALRWRCALAVRAARRIYAAIGTVLRRRGHDVFAGRAVVSGLHKLGLVAAALGRSLLSPPRARFRPATLPTLRFPDDILPV